MDSDGLPRTNLTQSKHYFLVKRELYEYLHGKISRWSAELTRQLRDLRWWPNDRL